MAVEDILLTAIAAVSAGVAIRLSIRKIALRFRIIAVVDWEVRGSASSDWAGEPLAKG